MRAVGYVRVSSEMQVDGHSLDAQRYEIERYCEAKGWELGVVYADEGASAYKDSLKNRPGLRAALAAAEAGESDIFVIHELSRLARNISVQSSVLARLGTARVGFDAVIGDFDMVSPQGRLVLTMLGGVNEFFSGQLAEHTKKGMRERARQGYHNGPLPFGSDSAEAPAVVEAFERRSRGQAYQQIADWLNAEGHATKRGNPWSYEAVREMLKSRYYLGEVSYDGEWYPGQHEAILEEAMWNQAQRQRHTRAPHARPGTHGALHGRVYCGHCERRMHADRGYGKREKYHYYRHRHRYPCDMTGRSISSTRIDAHLGEVIQAMRLDPGEIRRATRRLRTELTGGVDLRQINAKRERASELYLAGHITRERYELALADIDAEAAKSIPVSDDEMERVTERIAQVGDCWGMAGPSQKHEMIAELIDRAYIDIETGTVGAIVPQPGPAAVLEQAVRASVKTVGTGVVELVDLRGLEPLTSTLPVWRSPS